MDSIRGRDDDTPQPEAPTPPNITSKSSNISQSKVNLTDSGLHRASSRPTLQGRPSYASITRNAPSSERLEGAAGANPATASGQPSRRREPRPTENQTTAIPGATLRGRQATTERRDASQFDNELDERSRAGQPPPDADNTQSASVYPISSSKSPNISASKEARAAQRGGVTTPGPIASAGSMQLNSQLHPVTNSPPSRNVLPSRALQGTGSNVSLVAPGLEETREKNETPRFALVDPPRERAVIRSHAEQLDRTASVQPSVKPFTPSPSAFSSGDRNAIRPHAEQVDRTASIRQSVKPSTPPPPPLKRPSASTSPLPSFPAPALVKKASSRMHTPRGTLPYESQAPSRGSPFESPHPLSEDREKARPDEQGRKVASSTPHRPSAPLEHIPATTEPPSRQELNPSSTPRRSPVPLEYNHTMAELPSRQDLKGTSAAQHEPPAPSEQTPAATEPFRKGHKDAFVTPHRPLTPHEHAPTTTELPSRLGHNPSSVSHRPSVLSERSHAMTELPSRLDLRDPSATQHRPPPPSEHTFATREPPRKSHKDPPATPHGPPASPEHVPVTIEPPSQLDRNPSFARHRPSVLSERAHPMTELPSRQDRKDHSAAQHGPLAPSEDIPVTTLQSHKGHSATPQGPTAPPEHTPATAELPSLQGRKASSATPARPLVPPERTFSATELPLQGPSAVPHGLPVPTEHAFATIAPPTFPQQVSGPLPLEWSNSRIQRNEGVSRGTEQAMERVPSVRKEQKRVLVPKEREDHREDSANAEFNATTSYLKPPQESSVQRTYSHLSRENDSSASHLYDASDSRKKAGRSSNSVPPLDRRETHPQSSKGSLSPSPQGDMKQRDVSPAGLQRGPSLNRGYSSQPSLHPGGLGSQERLSRLSSRTSNVLDGTVRTQPARVEAPNLSKYQQGSGPPPPGNRSQSKKTCCCF